MVFKNFKIYLFGLMFTFFIFQSAFSGKTTFAHITLLQPKKGDVLEGASEFTIKWEIDEDVAPDENWDIRFSRDDGKTSEVVVEDLESTVRQFDWSVPDINTRKGRIEVIEDRPTGADGTVRSGTFRIVKTRIVKTKAFSLSCEDDFSHWVFGLKKLVMNLGNEQSCILKLTHPEPGVLVEISTNLRTGRRSSIEVLPISDIVDENGEIEFTITGINEGIDWVSWAAPDSEGKFEFTKEAFDEGRTWGMFVEVK